MSVGLKAIYRLVIAFLILANVTSVSNQAAQVALGFIFIVLIWARFSLDDEGFDRAFLGAFGFLIPTFPWFGSEILLFMGLFFFLLRAIPQIGSLIWIAPMVAYLVGCAMGEATRLFELWSSVPIDSVPRGFDILRGFFNLYIYSWGSLARISLIALFVALFSDGPEADIDNPLARGFLIWFRLGCVVSASFILAQWWWGLKNGLGAAPFNLPNQTPLWNSLGRPSGLVSDPNALGIVLALALWVSFVFRGALGVARPVSYLWVVLVLAAGVVSGSRTFLLSTFILGLAVASDLLRSRFGSSRGSRLFFQLSLLIVILLVGVTTIIDLYSDKVSNVVASVDLPVGIRRGISALSLLRLHETVFSRGVFMQFAREIVKDHHLFGVGADRFIDYVPLVGAKLNLVRGWRDNANNFYLGLYSELGLIGLLAFVLVVLARCRRINVRGSFLALVMLAVIGLTGPHTAFIEVLPLFALLIVGASKSRILDTGRVFMIASVFLVLGIVSAKYREQGVYPWSDAPSGASRWLSHLAVVQIECKKLATGGGETRLTVKARYIPQSEPLRVMLNGGQQFKELFLVSQEPQDVVFTCDPESSNIFSVRVETKPPWSPYRAWPTLSRGSTSKDRRILGVEQVFIEG